MEPEISELTPGTKVKVLIDTWMAPAGAEGKVHHTNLSEGLVSIQYEEPYQGVFDFNPLLLEVVNE